jgi:hypothetical protein
MQIRRYSLLENKTLIWLTNTTHTHTHTHTHTQEMLGVWVEQIIAD